MEELADLPEEQAVAAHLDDLAWARLSIWARLALFGLFAWFVIVSEDPFSWLRLLPVASLLLFTAYFLARRRGLERLPFLRFGFGFLLVQMLLVRMAYDLRTGEPVLDFLLPPLLLVFPLPLAYQLGLLGVFWLPAAAVYGGLQLLTGGETDFATLTGYSVYLLLLVGMGRLLYRRRVKLFLESWQRARTWALEGRRMRAELDQARRIQVSMLPQGDPYSSWLDIAGVSRPATEVGGDYYDYFPLGNDRQAVVVADVAGHGVASGLLLAGVRGCLVMLHEAGAGEEVPAPPDLLARLSRVVRTVGGRRTFVTMVYCLFERDPARLTLAAAGHPPLLRFRAGSEAIEEIALPSLPLGTNLASTFPETSLALEAGDVFMLSTDGIAEAENAAGDFFGETRLAATLKRVALGATAAEIREAVLAELEAFLGSREGQDDVTLVVVRVKNTA